MTMTQEREADAPPEQFDIHAAELAALAGRVNSAKRVRYAYGALGAPNGPELVDFIAEHGGEKVSKGTLYGTLAACRTESGHPDTGTMSKLTDDVIARMDSERSKSNGRPRSNPVQSGPVQSESIPVGPLDSDSARVQSNPVNSGADQYGKPSPRAARFYYLVALAALMPSLDTNYRFFGERLGVHGWERWAMFSVLELALCATAFGMADSVRSGKGPGPSRIAMYALCAAAGFFAVDLAGPVNGTARLVVGPLLGTWMLHLALGIERRARTASVGTWARIGRELRERFLSRLGLADDERGAAQRTRDRAATRAVELTRPARWRLSRKARLQRALLAAGIADDPQVRERFLARLQVNHHAGELADLDQGSPWN